MCRDVENGKQPGQESSFLLKGGFLSKDPFKQYNIFMNVIVSKVSMFSLATETEAASVMNSAGWTPRNNNRIARTNLRLKELARKSHCDISEQFRLVSDNILSFKHS